MLGLGCINLPLNKLNPKANMDKKRDLKALFKEVGKYNHSNMSGK